MGGEVEEVKTVKKSSGDCWVIGKITVTIEFAAAILLALTALGTAWSSWMSELHQSNQAQNYANSSALYSQGSAMINSASIEVSNSVALWNQLISLYAERNSLLEVGEDEMAQRVDSIIEYILCSLYEVDDANMIREALLQTPIPNLYDAETIDAYYDSAREKLEEGFEALDAGNTDNLNADSFGLVRVLYSIVMFLTAAIGIYKEPLPRKVMLVVGVIIFVLATLYMFSLPMPTDFSFRNYIHFQG